MPTVRTIVRLALKDLRTEFRRPHELSSALMFTFASTFIFGLGSSGVLYTIPGIYPAMIWLILYFAGTFLFASSFLGESDQGTIGGLKSLPFSMNYVLYGKVLYCLILLTLIMSTLVASTTVFLNVRLEVSSLLTLLLIFFVSAVGFSLLGCLTSALLLFSEGKRLLIVFILLPISLPILIPCISSTRKIAQGSIFLDILPEMQLIVAFTILVCVVSYLTFESIISEQVAGREIEPRDLGAGTSPCGGKYMTSRESQVEPNAILRTFDLRNNLEIMPITRSAAPIQIKLASGTTLTLIRSLAGVTACPAA